MRTRHGMPRRVRTERRAALLAVLCGAAALAVAWFAEHVLSMAPCALCLLERWPYRVLAVIGVLAMLAPPRAARMLLVLCAVPLLASVGLALTHVGVEQGWWPDPWPACMAPHFHGGSIAERLASMPRLPSKPCDSPNRLFAILPLSMASLDLIYAVLISAAIALAARPRRVS